MDRLASGRHLGSTALRAFADDVTFDLWVTGHVHEQRGAAATVAGRPIHNAARTILDLVL